MFKNGCFRNVCIDGRENAQMDQNQLLIAIFTAKEKRKISYRWLQIPMRKLFVFVACFFFVKCCKVDTAHENA